MSEPERVVLVRGLARAAGHWHDFDAGLRACWPSASFERFDLAGNGDRFRERSPLDVHALADDLRARVLARDPRPPLLIAISLGAMVGLAWWLRWPSSLRGLVGLNTSAGGVCPPWWRLQPRAALATFAAMGERDAVARELHILALTSRVRAGDRALAAAHARLHAREPIRAANVVRQMIAAARFRVQPMSTRTRPPLLLLAARGDRMVDPRCTPALARALGAAHFLHGDAGHDLTLDDPAWCTASIAAWFAAQS